MKSMNFRNIGILNIKSADYCCIISGIKTNEALNLIQNADLRGETGTLQNKKLLQIEMAKEILTFDNIKTEKKIYSVIRLLLFIP